MDKTKLLNQHLMLIRNLLLARSRDTLLGVPDAGQPGLLAAEAALGEFEDRNRSGLEKTYAFKLSSELEDCEFYIVFHVFFRGSFREYDRELDLLISRSNQKKLPDRSPAEKSVDECCSLFFTDEELVRVLVHLAGSRVYTELFTQKNELKPETRRKILGCVDSYIPPSTYYELAESRMRLKDVVLDDGLMSKILAIAENYRQYLEEIDNGLFGGSVRGCAPVVLFEGMPGTGKSLTAEALAGELGLPFVTFQNLDQMRLDQSIAKIFEDLNRTRCVVLIDDFEKHFGGRHSRHVPDLLKALQASRNMVILTVNDGGFEDDLFAINRRITHRFFFKFPSAAARKILWKAHLPEGVGFASEDDLDFLSSRYILPGGHIKNAMVNLVSSKPGIRRITFTDMKPLVITEREKMLGVISQFVRLCSRHENTVDPVLLDKLSVVRDILENKDQVVMGLPLPVTVGFVTEYGAAELAYHLSEAVGRTVILNGKWMDRRESFELTMLDSFLDSIDRDEVLEIDMVPAESLFTFQDHMKSSSRIRFVLPVNSLKGNIVDALKNLSYTIFLEKDSSENPEEELFFFLEGKTDTDLRQVIPNRNRLVCLKHLKFLSLLRQGARLTRVEVERTISEVNGSASSGANLLFGQNIFQTDPGSSAEPAA